VQYGIALLFEKYIAKNQGMALLLHRIGIALISEKYITKNAPGRT